MIEIKNADFGYGKAQVLKNVNLTLEKGKIYTVIGPNGSGKTTLIRLLSRLLQPSDGELLLDGRKYKEFSSKEFAKAVSLMPQESAIPDMTVFDFVSYGRYPYFDISRRPDNDDIRAVNNALEETNTAAFAQRNVRQLSGGERRRVCMAMLLAQDTDYVFLDEPSSSLDALASFETLGLMKKLKSKGKCVVAVLHELPSALKISDEIITVNDGGVFICETPEKLLSDKIIEKIFNVACITANINGEIEYIIKQR